MELNKQQLDEIFTYLGDVPAKYANPLINFLQKINKEQEVVLGDKSETLVENP
jgi:hypothetical protein